MGSKPKVAIVNYGVGNLWSVTKALEKVGARPSIIGDLNRILGFDAIILPGVGAFKPAMRLLEKRLDTIEEAVSLGIPILGICLGMQLLFTDSTEGGSVQGLDLIPGRVEQLPRVVKIPHMGWNTIDIEANSPLLEGLETGDYFYFVHSYVAIPQSPEATLATTLYGVRFPSIIAYKSIYGTQFHPEKSGRKGLKLLGNLVKHLGEV